MGHRLSARCCLVSGVRECRYGIWHKCPSKGDQAPLHPFPKLFKLPQYPCVFTPVYSYGRVGTAFHQIIFPLKVGRSVGEEVVKQCGKVDIISVQNLLDQIVTQ